MEWLCCWADTLRAVASIRFTVSSLLVRLGMLLVWTVFNDQYIGSNRVEGADLSKELDLQISGAENPTVWRLLGVRFILLPYTLGKVSIWVWHRCDLLDFLHCSTLDWRSLFVSVGDMASSMDMALLDKEAAVFVGWCFVCDPHVSWSFFIKLEKHEWVLYEKLVICNK